MPWHVALENAHIATRGAEVPMAPFLSKSWYGQERLERVLKEAGWEDVVYEEKEAWLVMADVERWARIAWTFLGGPVVGWQEEDERRWEEAVGGIVSEIRGVEGFIKEGDGGRVRMGALVAVGRKSI